MEKIKIGNIEGYDVLYLPEKDLVFCKNTVLTHTFLKSLLNTSLDRIEVPEKNLVVRIFPTSIELGCLTSSKDNFRQMSRTINKLKRVSNN